MKVTIFGAILLCACVLEGINYASCKISENSFHKSYNQDVQEIANKQDDDALIQNNILGYLKWIKYLTSIHDFIKMQVDSINITNSICFQDLTYLMKNIDFNDIENSWALKMLDSFGKPESGILEGNVKFIGEFDECLSVHAPKSMNDSGFVGKYCSLQVSMKPIPVPITLGLCLPDTCNPSDFEIFNTSILNSTELGIKVKSFSCKPPPMQLSNGGVFTLFIIFFFLLLVLLGSSITAYKYFMDSNLSKDSNTTETLVESAYNLSGKIVADGSSTHQLEIMKGVPTKIRVFIDKCDPFLNCFCIFTNGSKLLNTDSTEGQLLCLNGIRFLSMSWVILCHVYVPNLDAIRSLKAVVPLVDNLPFQAILNGWYSVDSFFVLSGFLMAYLYFQECNKRKGETPWLYFYIHRYLRLTPVYMIVLAFNATVSPVMGSGPFWKYENVDSHCKSNWWWNLLYINNFLNYSDMCAAWTWYLANDMQFFVISPLFLITLWRRPKIGFSILGLFICGSWLAGFLITYEYNLLGGTLGEVKRVVNEPDFLERWQNYMDKIYEKPYTRIAPYLIGLGLGYILFKRRMENTKANRSTLWIGWLLAVPAGLYCIYGTYHQIPSLVAASFFNALSRTIYGLSLSWLIFVCLSGQGGVIDKILSYKLFIPLSRLTYSAYLIHPILISRYLYYQRTTFVFSHQTMVLLFLGFLIVTYAFSILVSLTFESPLIRLEKLVRKIFQSK